MRTLHIRSLLGLIWFYLLTFTTATVVISSDAGVRSLARTLSLSNLSAAALLLLLFVLAALPSLILFWQWRWGLGVVVALIAGIISWGVVLVFQAIASPLTVREALDLLLGVLYILGGWVALVSLPAALFLTSTRQH